MFLYSRLTAFFKLVVTRSLRVISLKQRTPTPTLKISSQTPLGLKFLSHSKYVKIWFNLV